LKRSLGTKEVQEHATKAATYVKRGNMLCSDWLGMQNRAFRVKFGGAAHALRYVHVYHVELQYSAAMHQIENQVCCCELFAR
jgi:hypothetical protein